MNNECLKYRKMVKLLLSSLISLDKEIKEYIKLLNNNSYFINSVVELKSDILPLYEMASIIGIEDSQYYKFYNMIDDISNDNTNVNKKVDIFMKYYNL